MQKLLLALLAANFFITGLAFAELADQHEARRVCGNWLAYMVDIQGDWAASGEPRVAAVEEIIQDDIVLGYCFSIDPDGYVLVPVLKALAPVKASSQVNGFDPRSHGGFPLLVRENLHAQWLRHQDLAGEPEDDRASKQDPAVLDGNHAAWARFLVDEGEFDALQPKDDSERETTLGPLLTTAWHQGPPYNQDCPLGDEGLCIVGCVATAMAQIMVYHRWPPVGQGHHHYDWNGDGSCGGVPRGATLIADFADPIEWNLMPDICNDDSPQRVKDAVAELCYETAVSVDMDFGSCWSGTDMFLALTSLPTFFRFQEVLVREDRSEHTPESWSNLLRAEAHRGLPVLYGIELAEGGGHAMVCDGWRDAGGFDQVHINYGWGDAHTAWYALDDIYLSADSQTETMVRNILPVQDLAPVQGPTVVDSRARLLAARPNPFNPRTTISFRLPGRTSVTLAVFDLGGRQVAVLVDDHDLVAGTHFATWNGMDDRGRAMPSGTYFYRLVTERDTSTMRMTLLK